MSSHTFKSRMSNSSVRILLASTLALTAFLIVVALNANTTHTAVAADETGAWVGSVCFYQNGYPVCVERAGLDATTEPAAVTPEALLVALLTGPSLDERAQGLDSALPPDTRLVGVKTNGQAITVQLAFPEGYLTGDEGRRTEDEEARLFASRLPALSGAEGSPLAAEAIVEQIIQTLFPLGYRDFHVLAQDPLAPDAFRPLSAYLPPITIPPKASNPQSPIPNTQPPVESHGRPQGALSGKTVYVSAGHGWQYTSGWRTQRPPYPDATTGYYGPIIEDHNNAEVVNQYLLRYLWNAGADVWTARERDLHSFESIVDNADALVSGVWQTTAGGYPPNYLWTATTLSAAAAVTWTSDPVAADGAYALYVWTIPGPDRAPDAHYTVYHAGGSAELTVDQRHHGHTWRYVGSFPVRAGETLTVVLDNRSTTPGAVVTADAIRLGGGWFDNTDLWPIGAVKTEATDAPNKPWFEAAAYYSVQRLGVDPDNYAYFNDVIARPLWARWEHANTGDDALYISWHTNGYNGHNETVWGTVSYIHSYQAVDGSAALRHAVHSELINDARAGWDPAWRDLGEGSGDFGELRELWDDEPTNAIPGVLLEVAYHDHVGDTNALKDPRFAMLSARAVYQSIVKYYESRDGVDLTLLPEPPTHLTVRNNGLGQVTARWRPSPVDAIGLVGDAAESYCVYTSPDGLGWDNGMPVTGASYTLSGLQANQLIFVRVTAVNAGGESFPTPVLAARVGPEGVGRVLLVDGFDRIDRHGLIIENDPVEGTNARMFIDQINRYDYAIAHGAAMALPFDSALNEAVADGDLSLALYNIVDWFVGEESSVDHTFDSAEQAALSAYLEGGGGLFVSGAEIGWDLVYLDNGPDFHRAYLGADYAGDDAGTYWTTPTEDGIFDELGTIVFDASYDADYPDQLTPLDSIAALNYVGGNGGVAAVQYDAGNCRRVVYLGFPFETIEAAQRADVMERVINYLSADGCLSIAPQTAITTPLNGAAFSSAPDFGGTAGGTAPIEQVEVQIVAPDGRYWDGHAWVTPTQWLAAAGAAAWSYPLPPAVLSGTSSITMLEQGEYRLWARAWDSTALSDTTPAFSSFIYDTLSPTTPTLIAPADGVTLTGASIAFRWMGPLSDTGSTLAYHLQIDDQHITQTHTQFTHTQFTHIQSTLPHIWRVHAFDAAGNRSPWTPEWTFFVEQNSVYLPIILKGLAPNESPVCANVMVNGGFESEAGWSINATPIPAAYSTAQVHSGTRSMRLGLVPPADGVFSFSSVDQTIPLPAGVSATLIFWLYPINENTDDGDLQYLGLYDKEGTWTTLWSGQLNTQSWTSLQIDLTPYLGQVVNLRFSVKNDGDDDTTALYLDDVRLEVCGQ